jgi:serine/threonine protein kinase
MADVDTEFGKIIGKRGPSFARSVISRLQEEQTIKNYKVNQSWFLDDIYNLEAMEFNTDSGKIKVFGRHRNTIRTQAVGKGTYGTTYISLADNVAYKEIRIPVPEGEKDVNSYFEKQMRQIYLEVFIQCVCACDAEVGNYICKPIGLYRRNDIEKGKPLPLQLVFIVKMETIKTTFSKVVTEQLGYPIGFSSLAPYFRQIGQTLDVLSRKYNFRHGDLHCGNLMVSHTGSIKIIDFGMSCLEYNGMRFRKVLDDLKSRPCEAYDLLLMLVSFIEWFGSSLDKDTLTKVHGMLTTPDGKVNAWNWAKAIFDKNQVDPTQDFKLGAIFHVVYVGELAFSIGSREKVWLNTITALNPATFASLTASGGRRRNTRARKQKKHSTRRNFRKN